jgi:hypothetical protein
MLGCAYECQFKPANSQGSLRAYPLARYALRKNDPLQATYLCTSTFYGARLDSGACKSLPVEKGYNAADEAEPQIRRVILLVTTPFVRLRGRLVLPPFKQGQDQIVPDEMGIRAGVGYQPTMRVRECG